MCVFVTVREGAVILWVSDWDRQKEGVCVCVCVLPEQFTSALLAVDYAPQGPAAVQPLQMGFASLSN